MNGRVHIWLNNAINVSSPNISAVYVNASIVTTMVPLVSRRTHPWFASPDWVALTVHDSIGDGQQIGRKGVETQPPEREGEVLSGRGHGDLENQPQDIKRPRKERDPLGLNCHGAFASRLSLSEVLPEVKILQTLP